MNTPVIILTVILVLLISTVFILVLNFRSAKSEVKSLNFRLISTQLVVLTLWMAVLARSLESSSERELYINLVLFITSIIFGSMFIRGVVREVRTRDMVFNLVDKVGTVNDRLVELDKRKSEFVSFASHQLRGPMSAIQGYSSLILEGDYGDVPKSIMEPTSRILKSSRILGSLISDFLDVVKIEKGEMAFDIQTFNLINVLDEVLREYEIIFKRAQLQLIKSFNEKESIKVRGDQYKIKQVISNIVDNAIKYTIKGNIAVSIATTDRFVVIAVRDTGIGIEPGTMNDLFKKFTRARNAEKIDVMGSGLGLFVAREIMTAQNGDVWAESAGEGRGSTFYIKIPLAKK